MHVEVFEVAKKVLEERHNYKVVGGKTRSSDCALMTKYYNELDNNIEYFIRIFIAKPSRPRAR